MPPCEVVEPVGRLPRDRRSLLNCPEHSQQPPSVQGKTRVRGVSCQLVEHVQSFVRPSRPPRQCRVHAEQVGEPLTRKAGMPQRLLRRLFPSAEVAAENGHSTESRPDLFEAEVITAFLEERQHLCCLGFDLPRLGCASFPQPPVQGDDSRERLPYLVACTSCAFCGGFRGGDACVDRFLDVSEFKL